MTRDIDLSTIIDVDPAELDPMVRKRLESYLGAREERLSELRVRALEAEQTVRRLDARIEDLESARAALEAELESEMPDLEALDPQTVFASFGEALQSEHLEAAGFAIGDLSVDLRATVVQTDDGVRLHLPTPGSDVVVEGLSDLRFSVRAQPDNPQLEYESVPDLLGMDRETAGSVLERAGFSVGAVDARPADTDPGTVLEQLPSPFSLAEPGAPIDLVVAELPADTMIDLIGRSLPEAVTLVGDRFAIEDIAAVPSDEPAGTIVDQTPSPGTAVSEPGVSVVISEYPEPEATTAERIDRAFEAHGDRESALEARDVTEIDGIGETYGQRLRTAGIRRLADLQAADLQAVADAAGVSTNRAEKWVRAIPSESKADDERADTATETEDRANEDREADEGGPER